MSHTLADVRAALGVLYGGAQVTPDARRAADTYLTSWRDSSDAWAVADALLSSAGASAGAGGAGAATEANFAAITLHQKTEESGRSLPSASVAASVTTRRFAS